MADTPDLPKPVEAFVIRAERLALSALIALERLLVVVHVARAVNVLG